MNPIFKTAYDNSYFTVEGAGGDLNDWFTGINELFAAQGIGHFDTYVSFSGKEMNKDFHLHDSNAYPNDLTFFAFPLDGLDMGKLAIFKLQFGARWFDDIVDNNAAREGYIVLSTDNGLEFI